MTDETRREFAEEDIRISTGNAQLDGVLNGGLPRHRMYLIEGDPGSGKTTMALQFLLEGVKTGEPGIYVTLSETARELELVARSHGWSLDDVDIFELVPSEETLKQDAHYTMFHPSEVELSTTTKAVIREIEEKNPARVVFDSLSEMRLLAQNPLRYRRQILALKTFFAGRKCTVLLLDDRTSGDADLDLQSIVHGVIHLEQRAPEYGAERRRLRVFKMRGVQYRGGYHDFRIERGGLDVFPRLTAADHTRQFERVQLSSGVPELDMLLGGGLEHGTSALIAGPAGVGKSTLAAQYVLSAAERGIRAAMFVFDESVGTLVDRTAAMGMDLRGHIESGLVSIQQVDPAEMSPMEFAAYVQRAVEGADGRGAGVIVIDSLNGYLNSMPEERFLVIQLHELLVYLGQQGVVSFLVVAQHGMLGDLATPVDASYLADSVILLRYFEFCGKVRKAISILKKRTGRHEDTIRELNLSSKGLRVGQPLEGFQGVLTGTPEFLGHGKLMEPGS